MPSRSTCTPARPRPKRADRVRIRNIEKPRPHRRGFFIPAGGRQVAGRWIVRISTRGGIRKRSGTPAMPVPVVTQTRRSPAGEAKGCSSLSNGPVAGRIFWQRPGMRTCPPCVWPAGIRSQAKSSGTRSAVSGLWVSRITGLPAVRPDEKVKSWRRLRRGRRAGDPSGRFPGGRHYVCRARRRAAGQGFPAPRKGGRASCPRQSGV